MTLGNVERAVRRMPKRRRAIFLAVRLDGLSYGEIAERTGLSTKEVEAEIVAALWTISKYLDEPPRRRWRWWRSR